MKSASKAEASIRIRDNQRRSRARRKEYVQELEERIRSYEAKETEKNVEIQQASRRVAQDNHLLRSLLLQAGRSESDIDAYLQFARFETRELNCSSSCNAIFSPACQILDVPPAVRRVTAPFSPPPSSRPSSSASGNPSREAISELPPVLPSQPKKCCLQPSSADFIPANTAYSKPSAYLDLASQSQSYDQVSSPSADSFSNASSSISQLGAPRDSTSCDEAASIIASVRGGDVDQIRAELQCSSLLDHCQIQNSRLFEILDA